MADPDPERRATAAVDDHRALGTWGGLGTSEVAERGSPFDALRVSGVVAEGHGESHPTPSRSW
ncbi:MAG: hypothetical protein M0R73_09100 [Dehalococcoidia bacterium]|nr:hypothetical protein [Dehalococcoidia bacterium]